MARAATVSDGGLQNAENMRNRSCRIHLGFMNPPFTSISPPHPPLGETNASSLVMDCSPFSMFIFVCKVKLKIIFMLIK